VAAAGLPPTVPETKTVRFGSMPRSNDASSSVPAFGDVPTVPDGSELPPQAASTTAEVATTPRTRSPRLLSMPSVPLLATRGSWQVRSRHFTSGTDRSAVAHGHRSADKRARACFAPSVGAMARSPR